MKVFLGGIKGSSKWREMLIPQLKINYFNPESLDSSREAMQKEQAEKDSSDFILYFITPKMLEFNPVFEVVDDSNKRPQKTLFCYTSKEEDAEFSNHQNKSLIATGKMVERNGGKWFKTVEELVEFLNSNA